MTAPLTNNKTPNCTFKIILTSGKVIETIPEEMNWINANILARQIARCDMVDQAEVCTPNTRTRYNKLGYVSGEQL